MRFLPRPCRYKLEFNISLDCYANSYLFSQRSTRFRKCSIPVRCSWSSQSWATHDAIKLPVFRTVRLALSARTRSRTGQAFALPRYFGENTHIPSSDNENEADVAAVMVRTITERDGDEQAMMDSIPFDEEDDEFFDALEDATCGDDDLESDNGSY